jgi:hypothetical protein
VLDGQPGKARHLNPSAMPRRHCVSESPPAFTACWCYTCLEQRPWVMARTVSGAGSDYETEVVRARRNQASLTPPPSTSEAFSRDARLCESQTQARHKHPSNLILRLAGQVYPIVANLGGYTSSRLLACTMCDGYAFPALSCFSCPALDRVARNCRQPSL